MSAVRRVFPQPARHRAKTAAPSPMVAEALSIAERARLLKRAEAAALPTSAVKGACPPPARRRARTAAPSPMVAAPPSTAALAHRRKPASQGSARPWTPGPRMRRKMSDSRRVRTRKQMRRPTVPRAQIRALTPHRMRRRIRASPTRRRTALRRQTRAPMPRQSMVRLVPTAAMRTNPARKTRAGAGAAQLAVALPCPECFRCSRSHSCSESASRRLVARGPGEETDCAPSGARGHARPRMSHMDRSQPIIIDR